MRSVSPVGLRAMFARETAEVFLVTMRVYHPSFGTIRIVNNTEQVVKADGSYQPFPFNLVLPEDSDEQVPNLTVTFDNIDGTITDAIRTVTGVRPTCSFEVILASQPDTIEAGPFNFTILGAQYNAKTIECTLGFEEDILNQQVPNGTYTPSNSPGLYP